MKNFTRILSVVLVLLMMLSAIMVSASAAEFEDYYKKPDFMMGDVDFDNKISIRDCSAVQKHLAKIITLCEESLWLADVDNNGKVNISDATVIQKYVARMIDVFPADVYVPEYSVMTDGKVIEVLIPETEVVQVMVTVEEAGYYEIMAATDGEASISLDLSDEEFDKQWLAQADGEKYYIVAKLEAGVYFASMYTLGNSDTTVSFSAKAVDYKAPYDFESATELKAGDKIAVKAGSAPLVYKVDSSVISDMNVLYIYTEGVNSYTGIELYNSDGLFEYYGDVDESNNSTLALDGVYMDDVCYVVVTQDENGGDFTLCCNTYYDILKEEAKELSVGSVDECPITSTFDEEEMGGMIPEEAIAEAVYLFTPEKTGYYSFNYTSDSGILAIGYVKTNADYDYNYILTRSGLAGERVFDVVYLEEGNEYLFVTVVMLEKMGKVEFSILESDEAEYNKALEGAFEDDATDDEAAVKEIALGETVELTFASDDEFTAYSYKFTAQEDCEVVIYSADSVDAGVYIMNKNTDVLFLGDDIVTALVTGKSIELFESEDFAVKGTVSKGETIYFGVTSFAMGTDDSFKFSIVDKADYKAVV